MPLHKPTLSTRRTPRTQPRSLLPISLVGSPKRLSLSATGEDDLAFVARAVIAVVLIGVAPLIAMQLFSIFYPDLLLVSITPK